MEKLENCKRKAQARNFRDFATATGDEVNADIALEVVQHFGGLCEDFVLYFSEIIKKQHGCGEKSFYCSCRESCSMHTR